MTELCLSSVSDTHVSRTAKAGAGGSPQSSTSRSAPPQLQGGQGYYHAGCCRLDKGGNMQGGAVGPVSGAILPSMRETFHVHHEDESFKHVPFGELVSAYSSDP